MTSEVTFIYAAGLRVGAPVRGFCDLSPEWASRLRRANDEAFDRVVDTAVAREVSFVVLAGDVFDMARPSYGQFVHFFEGLERLDAAGIETYLVVEGRWLSAPWAKNAELLPASAKVLKGDGSDELPVGYDLCAGLSRGIQGCDSSETGEFGCHVVTLGADAHATTEFLPTSSVVFERLEIDVSACQTLADVTHLVQAELFRANGRVQCDETVALVWLVGETDLHGYLSQPGVIASLRKRVNAAYPSFFCDRLVDRTARPLAEGPLPKLVAEMAGEQRNREDVLINYAQSELVKRGVAVPSTLTVDVQEFNDAAERLVLDLLGGEVEGEAVDELNALEGAGA